MLTPDNSSIKSFKRGEDYSSSSVKSSTTPSRTSTGGKDFKKVLGQSERGQEDNSKKSVKTGDVDVDEGEISFDEQAVANAATIPPKDASSPLFNLAQPKGKQAQAGEAAAAATPAPVQTQPETPSTLFARLSSKKRSDYPGTNLAGVSENDLSKKGRIPSQFAEEQEDLSSFSQNANSQIISQSSSQAAFAPISESGSSSVKTPMSQADRIKSIEALVNQIVDRIEEVRKGDEGVTETVITLKNLPLFEGAKLYVTTYDQANKEFNIRFENLIPAAKDLIDMKQYQDSLRLSMQQHGYTVQILTATTYVETPTPMAEREDQSKRGNQDAESRQERNRQQQDDDSDKEDKA